MNQPTPFAQLGHLNKSGAAAEPSWKSQLGWTAADIGIGSIPVVGSFWNAGRGVYNLAKGNWGEGLGNLAGVGLGLVGLGGAAAAARGVGQAARGVGMMSRFGTAATNLGTKAIWNAGQGTGLAARGAQGLMRHGQKLNNFTGRLGSKALPGFSNGIGQTGAKMVVENGAEQVGGIAGEAIAKDIVNYKAQTPAPGGMSQQPAGNAPSWYSAVTGNASVPQYA